MGGILEVRSLAIAFGGIQALTDINFNVEKGEILGIIGPNGAGKTVLLNCINGIYVPNDGEILFQGKPITGLTRHCWAAPGPWRPLAS
ncbi:MAG: ATP-binding cassette domain-containing protein [Thermodesulfobacteriota bacterium]|nr:ATP-binding cassette domain-containing protein [Thermodesulfobacteriota bacterium]